ncbi:MAG: alpha/beta hydrolase [Solobacterium sp.]|nr:alpha/beta hydrolase [Solobacterium sp.]
MINLRMSDPRTVTEKKRIIVNGHPVNLLIVRPKAETEPGPGVLWLHGGGYATGMKEMVFMGRALDLVVNHGCTVVAPDYRLSVRHPWPAGLEDSYGALLYMRKHAGELNMRSDQLMVGGESAGGGLCVALCMLARDRKSVRIAAQMPLYPMLDDRDTESSYNNHNKIWNTRRNHQAWQVYLRGRRNAEKVPVYAAPGRQTNYRNLPPAYTFVCTGEPFYDETMFYVKNLRKAGVKAEVNVYPGMYHAFDMMDPKHPLSQEAIRDFNTWFAYAKANYFCPQEDK